MRIFFDTEFMEDGRTIELLSIGMVREDGADLYLEADWADYDHANPWVRINVLPRLDRHRHGVDRETMRARILGFAGERPDFWAYYGAYDWVVLCQLFGAMVDLPDTWPMWCHDLKQLVEQCGNPPLDKTKITHNALDDARWVRRQHELLTR